MIAVQAPVILARPPVPTWEGRRVEWSPWEESPRVLCTGRGPGVDLGACPSCGTHQPPMSCKGTIYPMQGETIRSYRTVKTKRSGREYDKPVIRPAHPYLGLMAFQCQRCGDPTVLTTGRDLLEAAVLICDGCNTPCAAAPTEEEARRLLVDDLDGWTGGADADWDLCRRCNVNRPAPVLVADPDVDFTPDPM